MEEKLYKQKGKNNRYPEIIRTWKHGEAVPEWLSDISRVSGIDNITGSPILETIETNTGGYSIISSDGNNKIVTVKGLNDLVCEGEGKIFSLNHDQLRLLYGEEIHRTRKPFKWFRERFNRS